jgi:hypothetical protein
MISLLTYLSGRTDCQDMHIFARECRMELQLPDGVPFNV